MADSDEKDPMKVAAGKKGAEARTEALSPSERSAIASRAALTRWGGTEPTSPRATHTGILRVAGLEIPVFVLEDGTRVISGRGFTTALGMKGRGQGMARILGHTRLKPFIAEDLTSAIFDPIIFRAPASGRGHGYPAEALVSVAEAMLVARRAGVLRRNELPFADASEILVRAFARVGIIALVDEATGYQEVRDREALQQLLDRYLRAEYAKWAKRFPDEFYQEMFRLRDWQWKGMKVNRPQVVAHYTNDIVYARLAPGILAQLQELNPVDERGRRKVRHHQWLTGDVGNPALQDHLIGVMALMRASTTWDQFKHMLQRAYPKINTNLELPMEP